MTSFSELLQQGAVNAWLFVPSAILLGALHGLEPGHSKTMMAAFIVAIRGTVTQAVMLGLAATVSHTMVVWAVALGGMYLVKGLDAETTEPYFQLASAVIIIGIACWMFSRTWQDQQRAKQHAREASAYAQSRSTGGLSHQVDTGHGFMALEIPAEKPAHWRLRVISGDSWAGEYVSITTERPDGSKQKFSFVDRDGYMESAETIAAPYEFMVRLTLDHGDHAHDYDVSFPPPAGTGPHPQQQSGLSLASDGYQDAHELSHANDIRNRFASRNVSNGQIVVFGLTGGLIPCPAAITVLLLCIQVKEISLGAVLVLCFSIGLAITLVTVGAVAAVSMRQASKRVSWISAVAGRAPYVSSALIILVGVYTGYHGWTGLQAQHPASIAQVRHTA